MDGNLEREQCFGLSTLPRWLILVISVCMIFTSLLLQGRAFEFLYRDFSFVDSYFLTFTQFICYALFSCSFFFGWIRHGIILSAPLKLYVVTSLSLAGSMTLANTALEKLNYPTQVLFRSSKIIPVMIGGAVINKRHYHVLEIIAALLIVVGLVGISIGDKVGNNKFDISGIVIITLSLICDSISSNLEERAFTHYNAPKNEVVSMVYLIGAAELGILSFVTGQMKHGICLCAEHPNAIKYILGVSFLGAISIQFIFLLISTFGSLVTVTVTSVRKGVTVLLSYLTDPKKKFTIHHAYSVICIGVGLVMNIYVQKVMMKPKDDEEHLEKDVDSGEWEEDEST